MMRPILYLIFYFSAHFEPNDWEPYTLLIPSLSTSYFSAHFEPNDWEHGVTPSVYQDRKFQCSLRAERLGTKRTRPTWSIIGISVLTSSRTIGNNSGLTLSSVSFLFQCSLRAERLGTVNRNDIQACY